MHANQDLEKGGIVDPFATVMDLMPTFLDLAGAQRPGKVFRGREVHGIRGKSWVDWIKGAEKEIHNDEVPIGWELHGRAALRMGDFKILFHRELFVFVYGRELMN
jgi:arylsulfatase